MKLLERQLSASHADDVNVDGELHPNFEASWREYMPGEWHAGRVCSISLISPKEPDVLMVGGVFDLFARSIKADICWSHSTCF